MELEEIVDKKALEALQARVLPTMEDDGWTDHVLSHLNDDEIFRGLPKADGLARVIRVLLGPIVESRAEVVQAPNPANNFTATIVHHVVVQPTNGSEPLRASEVADVTEHNVADKKFGIFPSAVCSTRARGRAYRLILGLKNVVTAEEVQSADDAPAEKPITSVQINAIDVLCKMYNINGSKFINSGKLKYKSITDIPYNRAILMMSKLNEWQGDSKRIPQDMLGYTPNWTNNGRSD